MYLPSGKATGGTSFPQRTWRASSKFDSCKHCKVLLHSNARDFRRVQHPVADTDPRVSHQSEIARSVKCTRRARDCPLERESSKLITQSVLSIIRRDDEHRIDRVRCQDVEICKPQ